MIPRPPSFTLFPYTTLFRSRVQEVVSDAGEKGLLVAAPLHDRRGHLVERIRELAHLAGPTCADIHVVLAAAESPYRSEEHTSELQSRPHLVCRLLLEKKNS